MEKRQTWALVGILITVTSTLGYAILSAPLTPKKSNSLPANFYTYIPGVDLSGLTEDQRREVLRILNTEPCNCGCGYGSLAACRNLDPTCSYSLARAQEIVAKYLEENRRLKEEEALKRDTDKDGLTDGEEKKLGTNATSRDTDGDGIADGLEVKLGTNPLEIDTVEKIEELKVKLADARLEGKITEEEFFQKLDEYNNIIAILRNTTGGGG
jgi:hypothetical protein